jgi:hypothetical protein
VHVDMDVCIFLLALNFWKQNLYAFILSMDEAYNSTQLQVRTDLFLLQHIPAVICQCQGDTPSFKEDITKIYISN